jgi:hypothetical protein
MPVIDFLMIDVCIKNTFGMGEHEIFEFEELALHGLANAGMADIKRYSGSRFPNQFFKKLRPAGPSGSQILKAKMHSEAFSISDKIGQRAYRTFPGKALG